MSTGVVAPGTGTSVWIAPGVVSPGKLSKVPEQTHKTSNGCVGKATYEYIEIINCL
jgi:hypothetical protein